MDASAGRLVSEAEGQVELEDNILVIRRIHVRLILKGESAHQEIAERVHGFFHNNCPVYRTLQSSIAITTQLVFEPLS